MRRSISLGIVALFALTTVLFGSSIAWAGDEDISPTRVIDVGTVSGPGSLSVVGVGVDSLGQVVVSKYDAGEITIYAPDASGAAVPMLTIPGLVEPAFLTIASDGLLYIGSDAPTSSIWVYQLDGTLVSTIAGANTTLMCPSDVDVDSLGNIYVVDCGLDTVNVFAPHATGNVAPARVIAGVATTIDNAVGLKVLGDGSFWVASRGNASLDLFASGASGNVSPIRTIRGLQTTLKGPQDVVIDSLGNLVVSDTDLSGQSTSNGHVVYFAPNSTGDTPPLRNIAGPNTGFTSTWGLTINAFDELFVADASGKILIFGESVPAPVPEVIPAATLASTGLPEFSLLLGLGAFVVLGGMTLVTLWRLSGVKG